MKRLWTTIRYTLTQMKGQIIGWGLGIAALGLLVVPFYDVFGGQQDQFRQMIESYPEEFLAFFGGDAATVLTPDGYLKMYAFSMFPIILGIFAIIAGSGLVVNDEERGRLDLIVAHPVSRTELFLGRVLGLVGAAVAISLIGWLGFVVLLGNSSLVFSAWQLAIPFVSLVAQLLVYAALAILLSMLLPTRGLASMVSGVVLVVSYFVSSMASLDESLEMAAKFLPHYYYQPAFSFQDLNLTWLFALLGISMAMIVLAWWLFTRRDIRLTGEGSWQLPKLLLKKQSN